MCAEAAQWIAGRNMNQSFRLQRETGMPFGFKLFISEVYQLLGKTVLYKYLNVLRLQLSGTGQIERVEIRLLVLVRHTAELLHFFTGF